MTKDEYLEVRAAEEKKKAIATLVALGFIFTPVMLVGLLVFLALATQ